MQSVPGEYEYLPHTADAKFRAYGETLEGAFRNAARAMTALLTDLSKVKPAREIQISLTAKNQDSLLFDFLDQLLFLLDTEAFLLHECKDVKITKTMKNGTDAYELSCTVTGDDYQNSETRGDVKAITYNDMLVEQLPDKRWVCQVVVDL